jgi:hypothetical protein
MDRVPDFGRIWTWHRPQHGQKFSKHKLRSLIQRLTKPFAQPIIVAQEILTPDQFAIVSASIPLSQYLSGSLAISVGNTIFQNGLPSALRKYAPDVDVKAIMNAGATDLVKVVSPAQLSGVLTAYNEALVKVFVSLPTSLNPPVSSLATLCVFDGVERRTNSRDTKYVPAAAVALAVLLSFGFSWDKIGMDDNENEI